MKKILWSLAVSTVSLFLVAMLSGCKGPEGPTGPKGDAGQNGTDGTSGANGLNAGFVYFDGFKDSLRCANCHNPETDTTFYIGGRALQWEESKHGGGTAWEENRSACAECHTTEGFMMKAKGMTVTDIPNATPPGCFACHSPHSNGNFSLRVTTAAQLTLNSNITGVAASTFNVGKGNLCVGCHRPRTLSPLPDPTKTAATDTLKITSNRWYAHYGVQGQILTGVGAFQWTDAAAYAKTAAHSTNAPINTEGCLTCHMADYSPANAYGDKIGGHTMKISYLAEGSTTPVEMLNGCKLCHSSITKLDYNGKITQFNTKMAALKALLVARKWIDTNDVILGTSSNVLKITPAARSGALFNYMMLVHDGSHGVHNPSYANSMLDASIAELSKP
ncbi:MAG: collagen-like protein [Ignavibacteriae bacterium]|nr:MAG: collagen-like protein [Ignavibacteriota bacterium]